MNILKIRKLLYFWYVLYCWFYWSTSRIPHWISHFPFKAIYLILWFRESCHNILFFRFLIWYFVFAQCSTSGLPPLSERCPCVIGKLNKNLVNPHFPNAMFEQRPTLKLQTHEVLGTRPRGIYEVFYWLVGCYWLLF